MRIGLFLVLAGWCAIAAACGSAFESPVQGASVSTATGFAAAGRIEGRSQPIEVGAGIDGVLEAVAVDEGQFVHAGQVLARVSCADLAAARSSAAADARAARMRLRILRNGTRQEDLDLARARVAAAIANRTRAEQVYARMQKLWESDRLISADDLDRAARESEVATASYLAASAEARRADAGPLPEEIAEADAQAERARQRAIELDGRLAKCEVRSPIAGTVLKKMLLPGETVSTVFPRPILTMANLSAWTVRAEVDEHDVDRVRDGMPVVVTAPAWGTSARHGIVRTVAPVMGRRRVKSGDPAEKSDRDVREVLIALDGDGFVVGLRVDVRFPRDGGSPSTAQSR